MVNDQLSCSVDQNHPDKGEQVLQRQDRLIETPSEFPLPIGKVFFPNGTCNINLKKTNEPCSQIPFFMGI